MALDASGARGSESLDEESAPVLAEADDASGPTACKIALFSSRMPAPVVAETRKVAAGLTPRRRNSVSGRLSPRSDLFKISKTGLRERKASLAICLSRSSGYLLESKVNKITSALSMASAIWSWMPASKSSLGSLRPAVSINKKRSSMRAMTLSRVVPSSRATMAIFLCAKRLSRLDLPALVWPIRATIGSFFMIFGLFRLF